MVIGIVGNWIEKTALIEDCVKNGQKVLLFFSAFQDPKITIRSECGEVMLFRERIQDYCSYAVFRDRHDLSAAIDEQLSLL